MLKWTPGGSGTKQLLRLDEDLTEVNNGCPSDDCLVKEDNLPTDQFSYPTDILTPETTYYWRVVNWVGSGCYSDASSSFVTPETEITAAQCTDFSDNDLDGDIDELDSGCCDWCESNESRGWDLFGGSCSGATALFWENPDLQEQYCCGNSPDEAYEICEYLDLPGNDKVSWASSCTSDDDGCCLSSSCVSPTSNVCYDASGYHDTGQSGNDAFAVCSPSSVWEDCDTSEGNCNSGCLNIAGWQNPDCAAVGDCWVTSGEDGVGEYEFSGDVECCGDDAGEVYEVCDNSGEIFWNAACIATDNVCCNDLSCVDPAANVCYDASFGYDIPSESDRDDFSYCDAGGIWQDCDIGSAQCTNCAGVAGFPNTCGVDCYIAAGEPGVGEYPDTNTTQCCGDDAGEYYLDNGLLGTDACCDDAGDCVDGDGACQVNDVWSPGGCTDGLDNNCNGLIDIEDIGCQAIIDGTITKEDGITPIPNATVTAVATDPVTGVTVKYSDITPVDGTYSMTVIVNLTYDIVVKVPGYGTGFEWDQTVDEENNRKRTIDFAIPKAENCEEDCTSPGENVCRLECEGLNGCQYFNIPTMRVCEGGQLDWIIPYSSTHEVQCCEGEPTPRRQTKIVGVQGVKNIVRVTRIISYGGQIITLVIDVFK